MAAPPPKIAHLMATADDVETQFYEALRDADIGKLMSVWSDDDDIVCVHPGGQRAVGADAIRASFEAIFERGGIPVRPGRVRRVQTLDAAVHTLVETVTIAGAEGPRQGHVVATNVYLKTPSGWRLVAHHASPGSATAPSEPGDAPTTIH